MRLLQILVSAVLLLASCGCSSTNISTNIITDEYQTEYSDISTELLEISYMNDAEFAKGLNEAAAAALEERLKGFEEDAKASVNSRPEGAKAEFVTKQQIKYAKNDFLSVVEEEYSFIGGAHGMTVWKASNIDFRNKKQIYLNDLFADENYEDVLNNMIDTLLETNKEEYSELWEHPEIQEEHQYNFYITDDDLVIYFQPYELSYYARGFVEFPLRLSELKGYLNEEYYFLADNTKE